MMSDSIIYLYGAPGSGKTTLSRQLAVALGCVAVDLDQEIEAHAGMSIPAFFQAKGEAAFRLLESDCLQRIAAEAPGVPRVVALGGGTLLNDPNRQLCQHTGAILCLDTPDDVELSRRLGQQPGTRPLGNRAKERAEHYAAFPRRITRVFDLGDSLVLVGTGIASRLLAGQRTIFDETVAALYPQLAQEHIAIIPSGEIHKTPQTAMNLWHAFAESGITRQSAVVSCGGGVTGDLVGFAAATWMRGIPWMNFPTTLLAMVDASTGGKTGCDLPEGKNLAGAFHSPRLVVIDTEFLHTLPKRELRSGLGEMLKHSIIAGTPAIPFPDGIPTASQIADSLAVKVSLVRQDPAETLGKRILLNCGHTLGHAVESASEYRLSHGECVAIGCVEEARLACRLGMAPASWPEELAKAFRNAGLPTALPEGMTFQTLIPWMKHDKKSQIDGALAFALPCGWGDVRIKDVKIP